MSHDVRLMTSDDLPAAAKALSSAFFKDPLQGYTFPDETERRERSPAHFSAALNYGLKFGEVYWVPNGAGAAIWLPPGETAVTPERAEAAGFMALPAKMGDEAFGRFFAALEYADQCHRDDVPEPHWYTMVVGVDPVFQGNGYGKALLQPVFQKADASRVPIYLETAQPANVTFYERLGFRVLRTLTEPTSGLPMWTFKRESVI